MCSEACLRLTSCLLPPCSLRPSRTQPLAAAVMCSCVRLRACAQHLLGPERSSLGSLLGELSPSVTSSEVRESRFPLNG